MRNRFLRAILGVGGAIFIMAAYGLSSAQTGHWSEPVPVDSINHGWQKNHLTSEYKWKQLLLTSDIVEDLK